MRPNFINRVSQQPFLAKLAPSYQRGLHSLSYHRQIEFAPSLISQAKSHSLHGVKFSNQARFFVARIEQPRTHVKSQKKEVNPSKPRSQLFTFEEFKEKKVESFEQFKESLIIKEKFGEDLGKITKAYNSFCRTEYARYKHLQQHGGNPALMV